MSRRRRRGVTLAEALAALGVAVVLLAGAAAATGAALQRQRAPAAARAAASAVRMLRSEAVARQKTLGLQLSRRGAGEWWLLPLEDGDGDGLRSDDLARGIDRPRGPARPLAQAWGVEPGFVRSLRRLRSPPPDNDLLGDLSDPVRLGPRDLVTASSRGLLTSGTIYLSDGRSRQMAVVVYGATGRVRVWEYRLDTATWVQR